MTWYADDGPALRVVPDPDEDERPAVILHPTEPHLDIDAACTHLDRDPGLYVRGKRLVRVIAALPPHGDGRAPVSESTPIVVPVEAPTLTERLTRIVRFAKVAKLSKKEREHADLARAYGGKAPIRRELLPAAPPPGVVAGVLARGEWPLRHLAGVSETPILRPDGSLVQAAGYDKATGYVYAPTAPILPVVDCPLREHAEKALDELREVFCDFPYVDEAARMVPIAALLTILARPAIAGAVPSFIFDATSKGSGKTLQCDAVCAVALGRSAARKSYPPNEEELGKVLAGYALGGARVVLFDNVVREFGGGEIDQYLTARDDVEVRELGSTGQRRVPWSAVIMASGNNIQLSEDTLRRVMVARLESPYESPEDRDVPFRHAQLYEWLMVERPRLVRAALTILRAYTRLGLHREDQPGRRPWASFEAWSRLVPAAIVYAGGADPLAARPRTEQHASEATRALPTILEHVARIDAGRGLTARELVSMLYPEHASEAERAADGHDALRDALEAVIRTRPGSRPAPVDVDRALRARAGKAARAPYPDGTGARPVTLVRLMRAAAGSPVRWCVRPVHTH